MAVFAAPLVFSLLIIVFIGERGAISRLLLTRPAQMIANLSFAIYMTHAVVLMVLLAAAHAMAGATGQRWFVTTVNPIVGHPGAHSLIQVLHLPTTALSFGVGGVYLGCVMVASAVAYNVVEVPGRAFFNRVGRRFAPKVAIPSIPSHKGSTPKLGVGLPTAQWDEAAVGTRP